MIDRDLTNREKLIMKCVWAENREISIQDLQDKLKEMFDWDAKRSTVRTFLTSIEGKGFVKIERRGRFSYIKPLVDEKKYKREQVLKFVDFWYINQHCQMMTETMSQILQGLALFFVLPALF